MDGVHLVDGYLMRFGTAGVEVLIRASAASHEELRSLAGRTTAAVMSDALFDEISPVHSPTGVLALAPLPEVEVGEPSRPGFQILLDGVQDPGNLGGILRSAAAAGALAAHLSRDCADPWSPKSLRGGMGAQFLLPVKQHKSLPQDASTLGSQLIACLATAAASVFDTDLSKDVAFIVGGEGAGISQELLSQAHLAVRVPMRHGIESLNAAHAATVCFYEWLRQASRSASPPA